MYNTHLSATLHTCIPTLLHYTSFSPCLDNKNIYKAAILYGCLRRRIKLNQLFSFVWNIMAHGFATSEYMRVLHWNYSNSYISHYHYLNNKWYNQVAQEFPLVAGTYMLLQSHCQTCNIKSYRSTYHTWFLVYLPKSWHMDLSISWKANSSC